MKRSRIRKLVAKSSDSGQARKMNASADSVGNTCTEQELESMESTVPQMLPPQAGFSNEFLFNELLDLWT